MLSPFPGMDPFLEDPAGWGDVHFSLIGAIREQLAEAVSPHFFVGVERRVYIVSPDEERPSQTVVPDVYLISTPSPEHYGSLAAQITMPLLIEPELPFEVREHYLEIRDVKNRQVVTTIELLSPGNKTPGNEAYNTFKAKRQTVTHTPVHWIEIDLLRAGERLKEVAGKSDYYTLLKRGNGPVPYEVWLFNLRDRLPTIAVPLRPPFADVPLDLQTAFETMYQRAHYADAVDYEEFIPLPRLRSEDASWVEEQVQKWLAAGER
jgi:hypothetical protein